jgi:hypothetical protein
MKGLVYSVKVRTRDALLGRILDAADRIRNSGSCNARAHWSAADATDERSARRKIFFPLLAMGHRTLIRTGRNAQWQFRLGGEYFSPRPPRPSDSTVKISLS